MIHSFLVAIVLFIAMASGNSKPLIVIAAVLIIFVSIYNFLVGNLSFKLSRSGAVTLFALFAMFSLSIISIPIENLSSFITTLLSAFLAALIISYCASIRRTYQLRVYMSVMILVLLGDIIHISGVLGSDMNFYKSLVQFDTLSNVNREEEIGYLGRRYNGWFAEPSYHGAMTGLLCALLWRIGEQSRALWSASVFFLLCPTPMMILAFATGILMGIRKWLSVMLKHPLLALFTVSAILSIFGLIFSSRIIGLYSGAVGIIGGENINSSETVRLIYPVISLIDHWDTNGWWPQSGNCITDGSCMSATLKVPLITFLVFFGIVGTATLVTFIKFLYREAVLRIFFVIITASILSGGGAYVLQFGLIVAIFMYISSKHAAISFDRRAN